MATVNLLLSTNCRNTTRGIRLHVLQLKDDTSSRNEPWFGRRLERLVSTSRIEKRSFRVKLVVDAVLSNPAWYGLET